jgi:hypothetical protein
MTKKTLSQPPNLDQDEFSRQIQNQSKQEFEEATKRIVEWAMRNQEKDSPLDLKNLPFDPAVSAMEQQMEEEETEEDGIRAEAIRRLKVHRMFKGRQDQTKT